MTDDLARQGLVGPLARAAVLVAVAFAVASAERAGGSSLAVRPAVWHALMRTCQTVAAGAGRAGIYAEQAYHAALTRT